MRDLVDEYSNYGEPNREDVGALATPVHGHACRESDREMASTPAGQEMISKAIETLRHGHKYFGAGEVDCPREIKAGNGELHTLRCRFCGQDNPRSDVCDGDKP